MTDRRRLVAILPCNDLDASQAFYERLGFVHREHAEDYRLMADGQGAELHLTRAVDGWLDRGRNPFGLYLYAENVDDMAARFGARPENKPWGMYEFALSDPDETNVRIGWPIRLRSAT